MTREQAKELLPIITAFVEGKIIQVYTTNGWKTTDDPAFDSTFSLFRIKPEPREFWLIDNHITEPLTVLYSEPNEYFRNDHPHCEIIHVIEVIE